MKNVEVMENYFQFLFLKQKKKNSFLEERLTSD